MNYSRQLIPAIVTVVKTWSADIETPSKDELDDPFRPTETRFGHTFLNPSSTDPNENAMDAVAAAILLVPTSSYTNKNVLFRVRLHPDNPLGHECLIVVNLVTGHMRVQP